MAEYIIDKRRSCLLKIHGSMDNLKSAERRIAQYIYDNPSEVIKLTINQLAEKCNSSYATVHRFCKKMGYSGFKELKNDLVNDVANQTNENTIKDISITPDMTTEEIFSKVYDLTFRILEDSFSILNAQVVDKVVDEFLKAKKIVFIGTGNSGLSAKYAYSKFFRIGLPCISENDATLRKLLISLTGKGDVVFAISSSGRSEEIVECARIAKKNGAVVVALSDFALSPISKTSDWNLYTTPRNVNALMNIDMPLTVSQLTIIDTIYICCCKVMGEEATKSYSVTKEFADKEKI